MAMSITQDTFDEVVKENMEDFGMDRQSAAEDAIGQFTAQGTTIQQTSSSSGTGRSCCVWQGPVLLFGKTHTKTSAI